MRVLYVSEALGGGVFELVRSVAEGVAERGHKTAIAYGVRRETPGIPREAIAPQVEIFETWRNRGASEQAKGALRLRRTVREWKPDLVHLYSTFAGVEGALSIPRSTPTVFTPQAFAFTMANRRRAIRAAFKLAECLAARRATVVGACSESEGKLARELVSAAHVVVIPNGIPELDSAASTELAPPSGRRVVALGRIAAQRQPDQVAAIFEMLRDTSDPVWVGGAGDSRATGGLQALARAGVPVTGWLRRSEVLAKLSGARAYLHWTAWDGLPLSVLEAMALDVPVIASDIGPNRELLGERQVCRTADDAVRLLRRILDEPEFAADIVRSQRARRDDYGAARMIERWINLYGRLSAEPPAQPRTHGSSTRTLRRRPSTP